MVYREFKPHKRLSPYVECYWAARSDKPPFREEESLIPDGTIEFMFNFGDPYFEVRGEERREVKGAHIIGIRKKALQISQPSRQSFFSIRFRVGGTYPLFRVPGLLQAEGLGKVLSDFNVGYKTLERRFDRVMGLSPMEFLRIHRFSSSVQAMYSGRYSSLTRIGYACGYYDQSHFIREFKRLSGFTPKEFLKERFTIVQVIQPALAERLSKLYNF